MSKTNTNSRIVWIDWARSFCMFLVILGHCHIRESEQFVVQYIYSFHMMFFFFLSGMLCKRELSMASLKKDLHFIILPYFTYGLIIIAFNLIRSRSFDWELLYSQLISLCVGDDISIGPIWFLPALFICKQLFLFIKKVKSKPWLYALLFVLSLFPVYFIAIYRLNFPFFADSALCGLPFFFIGYESRFILDRISLLKWYVSFSLSAVLACLSFVLCKYNGFVIMANCTIGKSVYLYYLGAFAAIISVLLICTLFNNVRLPFVTITSYGTIVTLGLHGIPLTFFHYYVPILLGYAPSTYPLYYTVFYSLTTYYLCYILIVFLDKSCPLLFGLKGSIDIK